MSQADWVERARAVLPAGGFGNFEAGVVIRKGRGARVWDEDGTEYIDYLLGSGPMILGHCHPEVAEAVAEQMSRGTTFFASNTAGIELAEEICRALPCAEQLRYVSSGSEADLYAIRLARAHTGRDKVLKFEGGYHGMSAESLMSIFASGSSNFPVAEPDSAGIPDSVKDSVMVSPFNDEALACELIAAHGDELACVIVEPFQRVLPPRPGFLEALRAETEKRGIILIFDEVVTGFRLAYGGAQERYGVVPDLCTVGKIVGGGFPLAAVAGRRALMAHFDRALVGKEGFALQIGTLSGNPIAAVAGLKTLEVLRRQDMYARLEAIGKKLMAGLSDSLSQEGVAHRVVGDASLFDVVFTDEDVFDYRAMLRADKTLKQAFNAALRAHGILKTDTKFYVSLALTEQDCAETLDAFRHASRQLK